MVCSHEGDFTADLQNVTEKKKPDFIKKAEILSNLFDFLLNQVVRYGGSANSALLPHYAQRSHSECSIRNCSLIILATNLDLVFQF